MRSPSVSVIMPVFNSEKYLADAIESILNQTFSDFEFLIFDDGSTDSSASIISSYAAKDQRIVPFYCEENSGYVVHLNKGILLANCEFIARMDSDDFSLPDRFACQVEYLENNRNVAVVGSSSIRINENGEELGTSIRNASPSGLLWESFFKNPLAHPTVMFRKSHILEAGLYDPTKLPAEDFDLWTRVIRTSEVANLARPLLKYRERPFSISCIKNDLQRKISIQTLRAHWQLFCNADLSEEAAQFFRDFHTGVEAQSFAIVRPAYYSVLRLYMRIFIKRGFVTYIEKDAFQKLIYLVLLASRKSPVIFMELLVLLVVFFPIRTFRKLIGV